MSDVTGFTPFYLLYGRRAHVPLERYLGAEDNAFGNRLDELARAYRQARENLYESRQCNRRRLAARANVDTSLRVGDTVTIKAEEAVTNTSRWDPQYQVIRVQGPVHWVRHQVTGKERKLNREKLTLADPAIIWDELPNRVKRGKWKTMRTRRPVVEGGSQGRVVSRARADPKIDKPKVRAPVREGLRSAKQKL